MTPPKAQNSEKLQTVITEPALNVGTVVGLTRFDIVADLFGNQGYAVFAPDSLERPGGEIFCGRGAMDDRIRMRRNEITYALSRIRKFNWIDQSRVLLAGFSEGGNATDTYSSTGFAAHIIFGSACTQTGTGSPAAPEGVPVLAVVGSHDGYRPGLSCNIRRTIGGSKSIVIHRAGHSVIGLTETRQAVTAFLKDCCSAPVAR